MIIGHYLLCLSQWFIVVSLILLIIICKSSWWIHRILLLTLMYIYLLYLLFILLNKVFLINHVLAIVCINWSIIIIMGTFIVWALFQTAKVLKSILIISININTSLFLTKHRLSIRIRQLITLHAYFFFWILLNFTTYHIFW